MNKQDDYDIDTNNENIKGRNAAVVDDIDDGLCEDINNPEGLTNEEIATAVSLDMQEIKLMGEQERLKMNQLLCDCIRNMVYKLAIKYSVTCNDEVDDLAQDCMYRIISQLWRYDSDKSKFTTWCWWVCRSVLNCKYRQGQKHKSFIADARSYTDEDGVSMLENLPDQNTDGVQRNECRGILALEIIDTIKTLASEHPKNKELLFDLFGNPDDSDFVLPNYISLSASARAVGMKYSNARKFYNSIVRPLFQEKFSW